MPHGLILWAERVLGCAVAALRNVGRVLRFFIEKDTETQCLLLTVRLVCFRDLRRPFRAAPGVVMFPRAQHWLRSEAFGLPREMTWARLVRRRKGVAPRPRNLSG